MLYQDDDETPSRSSAEYLTRADHGKQEQRERKAAQKGDLLALKRAMLRTQVDPNASPQKIVSDDRKRDEETEKKEEPNTVPLIATKTNVQLVEQGIQRSTESDTAETLIDKAKIQEDAKQQEGEEYQQNMS